MALWDRLSTRGNVEDRRGMRMGGIGGVSVGTLALVLALNYFSGGSVIDVLSQLSTVQGTAETPYTEEYDGADSYEVFASTVVGSNNDLWKSVFAKENKTYVEPRLVLFRDATESSCGVANARIGPHYCPLDSTIYLDETFFEELRSRFGATGGDVAEAYVIAHEVGHHVQAQLGTLEEARAGENGSTSNQNSINTELQADCFAGMWANSIRNAGVLGVNEIKEAMDAAAAVGDDRIQEATEGSIHRESWTHGSSKDREAWFTRGYESGALASCNTFS